MPRPKSGSNLSIAQLQNMISDRRSALTKLEKQKRNLERQLDDVDRKIEQIGGSAGGMRRSGRRARNQRSLADTIEQIMRGHSGPMGVGEVTDAVLATGYRSNSDSFRAIVNQTLIKERDRFMPTGDRGTYRLKKAEKAEK